ncbi:MAG: pyridoxal phosphate-dependent aminotransferase [Candidatus Latescibacterota bacterium]|nr:MAG: pyridoxal phosphate-dependent aminotransferase [Candidatus Latescibacterota bacterium]
MYFAERVRSLRPEGAYAVLAKAQEMERQGRDIVHFEIGQPDFQTFPNIAMAGIRAIAEGKTRYNPSSGLPALREAVAEDVNDRRGLQVRPEEVVIGPGAKPLLFFSTLALVEPGDEVLYPNPGYPTYEAMIRVAGGKPVPVPLVEEKGFSLDLDTLEDLVSDRTRMIILNSPGNPTGGIIPPSDLERIAAIAEDHDCWILSDEIYSRLIYDDVPYVSIASLPGMKKRTIVVDGFSKTYAMTGWRLGYGIMPAELAERVGLLLTHSIGCTATFTQYAGIEALRGPQEQVERARAEFERRRDFIVAGLRNIPGVRCQTPSGAFYVFPNVKAFGKPVDELADYILEEAGVALLPGTAFGEMGEGYLRICYATSLTEIKEGLDRITQALKQLGIHRG